jgi:hypothetical protein
MGALSGWRRRLDGAPLDVDVQRFPMSIHHPLDCLTGVHQQIETIRHLERIRRSPPRAIRIRAGAASADDFNPWMGL